MARTPYDDPDAEATYSDNHVSKYQLAGDVIKMQSDNRLSTAAKQRENRTRDPSKDDKTNIIQIGK